ncbi:hypothetical protein F2Q69_00036481 [Brassica cretica]|uniref:Uncharacterized protein n=1 Tax=Brassica cretica TaxID=69181 RepID=A0A8S9SE30_BRACR|nr:hypothetical protein F2Q69_00036481 [Brassica cretica]
MADLVLTWLASIFGLGQSLDIFEVVFLVVGLPPILLSRLGFQDMVFAFIAACVSLTLPFAMFATPGLDSVLLRVCSVDLEDGFWSQVWALSFVVLHRHRRLVCACLVCEVVLTS